MEKLTNNETTSPVPASQDQLPQLWLSVEEAAPVLGDPPATIYRDIRENQFPFEFRRAGRRIKISARSLGLVGAIAA